MLTFESSLTDEEIAENFKNISFFDGLMNGLNEALAYEKGSAKQLPPFTEQEELLTAKRTSIYC